jgi:hypothetical protein
MGSCGQHHIALLPFAHCCLNSVPVCTEPGTDRHELGKPYLWMPCCLFHDILLHVWKTYFRWTSRVLQAAVIYSETAMGIMYGTALTLAPTQVLRSPHLHVHRLTPSALKRTHHVHIGYQRIHAFKAIRAHSGLDQLPTSSSSRLSLKGDLTIVS